MNLPWALPVPVEPGEFSARSRREEKYNVVVACGKIPIYSHQPASRLVNLAWCDFQTDPVFNAPSRFGSGRSIYYAGRYLKGVGRTQLAGNWTNLEDAYHATGHLSTSAAIREYLVSYYLSRLGFSDSIVPCTAILVRPFRRGERVSASRPRGARGSLAAADKALHAVTVKEGKFARLSNLLFAFDRAGLDARLLIDALRHLYAFAVSPGVPPRRFEDCTPQDIAGQVIAAVLNGLDALANSLRAGVFWSSLHNNVTLDGRVVDLETPTIVGGPALVFAGSAMRGLPPTFEALRYLQQSLEAIRALSERLSSVAKRLSKGSLSEFLSLLARRLIVAARGLPRAEELERRIVQYVARELCLTNRASASLARGCAEVLAGGTSGAMGRLEPFPVSLFDVEPASARALFVPSSAPPSAAAVALAGAVNDAVARVEQATNVDGFFVAIGAAERSIRKACQRAALPKSNFLQ